MSLGFYFAELTEAVTTEESAAEELLRHLLNGLYALSALHRPLALVKAAFEWKLLSLAGYEPLVDSCAYCGCPEPLKPMLDVVQGVLRCQSCGAHESTLSMPLCPGFGGRTAAYRIWRSQAAVFLYPGAGRPGPAGGRGGGLRRGPAGAGL